MNPFRGIVVSRNPNQGHALLDQSLKEGIEQIEGFSAGGREVENVPRKQDQMGGVFL